MTRNMYRQRNNNKFRNKNKKNNKLNKFNRDFISHSLAEDGEIKLLQTKYLEIDCKNITSFSDFPLSRKTQKGLEKWNFITPTIIQKESIGYGLQGRDVLGAAITGSGKTLAFLIPVLENLFIQKWSRVDGIGAIIISPVRELAYQIFERLKEIGEYHDFSAGLIIGGKNLKFERSRMDQCNIIICTPGRLLQHMDENPLFNCSTMRVLVLDEADRCLDMGFETDMSNIIEHLPGDRQTLLFSATQTKCVTDLARLSLKNPIYVAPHEQQSETAVVTPDLLQQNYAIVNLEDKLTMIWSFIKNNLKQKCIIFLSSCKQVKYIYEIFCKLRPGTSVLALYGTLHQDRRMAIYTEFCRKSKVILFATDIASRGLDFPTVNWVIQLDCPEDVNTYIHRAGRTARHKASGDNLLVLMPSEVDGMLMELAKKNIKIDFIQIDPRKLFSPKAKIEAFLAQNQMLKDSAQRAFVAYFKAISLMKNKKIFKTSELDADAYARSLGLVVTPRIRFLQRLEKHREKNRAEQLAENESRTNNSENPKVNNDYSSNSNIPNGSNTNELPSSSFKYKKQDEIIDFNGALSSSDSDDNEDTEFLKVKRKNHELNEDIESDPNTDNPPTIDELRKEKQSNKKPITKAIIAKRIVKKKIIANKKVIFNEDGEEIIDTAKQLQSKLAKDYENSTEGGIDIEKAKELLREEDAFDKERFKQLVKAKHKKTKKKIKSGKSVDGKQDDQQDVFDEFGDISDNEPDLSWFPDLDKMYPDKDSGRIIAETNSDDSEQLQIGKTVKKKKKIKEKKSNSKRKASKSDQMDELDVRDAPPVKKLKKLTSKLSVNEAEALAMQLLNN